MCIKDKVQIQFPLVDILNSTAEVKMPAHADNYCNQIVCVIQVGRYDVRSEQLFCICRWVKLGSSYTDNLVMSLYIMLNGKIEMSKIITSHK
jgi:hypothetical protein